MRLARVEDQERRRRRLANGPAAGEFGAPGLGRGDDEAVMGMRGVIMRGEVRMEATQAREMRILPVPGAIQRIVAGHRPKQIARRRRGVSLPKILS